MMTLTPSLTESIAAIATHLRHHQQRLVTAESCTGGLLAASLTAVAGSSDWFEQGWVTYANMAKSHALGVSPQLIDSEGAVSEAVAAAMAQGALGHSSGQYAIAITGIAGPSGGTPTKPVGTVCFGWASAQQCHTETLRFTGDRAAIRQQAVDHALHSLVQFFSTSPLISS